MADLSVDMITVEVPGLPGPPGVFPTDPTFHNVNASNIYSDTIGGNNFYGTNLDVGNNPSEWDTVGAHTGILPDGTLRFTNESWGASCMFYLDSRDQLLHLVGDLNGLIVGTPGQPYAKLAANSRGGMSLWLGNAEGDDSEVLSTNGGGDTDLGDVITGNINGGPGSTLNFGDTIINPNGIVAYRSYTVATLPGATVGSVCFASNGRNGAETAGNGTGCLVVYSAGHWRRLSDNSIVLA